MRKFKEKGEKVEIYEPITFINENHITIKEFVRLSEYSLISGGSGLYIGNFIHIANHVSIIGGGTCILEDFVGISAGSRIITGSDDITGDGIPSPMVPNEFRSFYHSHVKCEKHSFIGTNVVIQPGVTIGQGTVVGSGSVVTKDLEPWGIYMGVPARRIKDRNKEVILRMEKKIYEQLNVTPSNFNIFL